MSTTTASDAATRKPVSSNPIIEVHSQAELDTMLTELHRQGYTAGRSPHPVRLPGDVLQVRAVLNRVGMCRECYAYVSLINIEVDGRTCDNCNTVLYKRLPRPHVSFYFGGEKADTQKRFNMEVVHWDRAEGACYFSYRFLNTINPDALMGQEAIEYLDSLLKVPERTEPDHVWSELTPWQIVRVHGEQALKVSYAINRSRKSTRSNAIVLCGRIQHLANYLNVPAPGGRRLRNLEAPLGFDIRITG